MKVLFLLPYPLHRAPSQRFRVEAFFPLLQKEKIEFRTHSFLDEEAWKVLYQNGSLFRKAVAVFRGYLSRLWTVLFIAWRYDYIFIHREAAPLGPPVFEWLLSRGLRKKVIFDFDDAIWIPNVTESNKTARYGKCFWKIKFIIRWASKVAAGNEYLANYAKKFNNRVVVLPTCVDTQSRYNRLKEQREEHLVIGWTGSHSTLPYLESVYPVLKELEVSYAFEFLVICNQPPSFSLRSLTYIPWKEETEIEDLLRIHIGLMPLEQDAWSEGKCGFKIIQYLSLGIPAVASPVGVNKVIVDEGVNGFLCTTEAEWRQALITLITNEQLRYSFGQAGRKKIEEQYSVRAHISVFLALFS